MTAYRSGRSSSVCSRFRKRSHWSSEASRSPRERVDQLLKEADRDVWRGIVEGFRHFRLMIQSSAIGTAIGIMPGLGAPVAHWISYAVARNTEKGAHETFGKGDIRGVIASDAPNSSADGGELFPTLAFGIPGTAGMSIMIAIFVLCGFTPGYSMMTNHLDVVVALVYVLIIANTLTVPIVMLFAPYLARLTLANPAVLAPIVIWVAMLAAYMTTNSVADLAVVLIFAVLGLFMKAYGWPRPPILIAVALGEVMEKYLWIAVNNYGFSMFARPQFLAILAVMGLVALVGVRMRRQVASTVQEVRQEALAAHTPSAAVIAAALPDAESKRHPSFSPGFPSATASRWNSSARSCCWRWSPPFSVTCCGIQPTGASPIA